MGEERRYQQRRKIFVSCQVEYGDRLASGRIVDASNNGLGVLLPEAGDLIKGEARIHIPPAHQSSDESAEGIALRARPVNIQKKTKGHRLGLKIVQVESGASEWTRLCREFKDTDRGQAGSSPNQPGGTP
ncbi:MAG TPA: PilZ domain-containing protein [Nitrospiraceae bacterium]|jgi:c-di-GMP-binding flagellar brake protein YcgR